MILVCFFWMRLIEVFPELLWFWKKMLLCFNLKYFLPNIDVFQGNELYMREEEESIHLESISQRGGKLDNWDDVGLANNPLNDR